MTELSSAIRTRGPDLARRATDEMYRDPFWEERFGERGRKFAAEDGHDHITYLVQALEVNQPDILTTYARGLQSVLVSRGMCTAHLLENFARLGRALGESGIPEAAPALQLLDQAQDALLYPEGPARGLQQSAGAIADAASRGYAGARVNAELRILVWYLADAVRMNDAQLFMRHAEWARGYFDRQELPPVRDLLVALDGALDHAPAPARDAGRAILAQVPDQK
jgi:hypothetical protein